MEINFNIKNEINKMKSIKLSSKNLINKELFWDSYRC